MNNKQKVFVSLVAAIALVGGLLASRYFNQSATPESAQAAAMPKRMVEFSLPDINDNTYSINQWRGKLILLNFWATWCPPCREEIPLFIDMQEKYGAKGLQIVGVAIDTKQAVENYPDFAFMNYPVLIGQEKVMVIMKQYGNRLGSLPYSVVIDPRGRVLSRKIGAYKRPEIETMLQDLLPES